MIEELIDFVTLNELSRRLNKKPSTVRAYVARLGFKFEKRLTRFYKHYKLNTLTKDEARTVTDRWEADHPSDQVRTGGGKKPAPPLEGMRVGQLTVIREAKTAPGTDRRWLCECDCGTETIVFQASLKNDHSTSCGGPAHRHGKRYTLTYAIWASMKQRCLNPKNKGYPNYGGRGIAICERWLKFEHFLSDMGECPPRHSIERIDHNGNYEPGNCKWIPQGQQNMNRRNNHWITYQGETLPLTKWAERFGLSAHTVTGRIKAGWSLEETFTRPPSPLSRNRRSTT